MANAMPSAHETGKLKTDFVCFPHQRLVSSTYRMEGYSIVSRGPLR
jgi:hypothetical protein